MKIAFVTCVQLGLSCIERIYEIGGKLDLLITIHDHKSVKKAGRIYLDNFSTLHNIPLLKISHINDEEVIERIKRDEIDWLFIIGWSQIANSNLINSPKMGAVGMHPTLLPIGRGRASVPWAIIKGLEKTGVTMFKLDEGVDTGAILGQYEIPLSNVKTATELYKDVNEAHKFLIDKVWPLLINDKAELSTQNDEAATYWEGRKPEDGLITTEMDIEYVSRLVRATTHPYPGAFYIENDKKYVVWSAKFTAIKPTTGETFLSLKDGFLIPIHYDILTIQ